MQQQQQQQLLLGHAGTFVYWHAFSGYMIGNSSLLRLLIPLLHGRLVLETDAPALGPDKAGINVPANILVSCAEVRAFARARCTVVCMLVLVCIRRGFRGNCTRAMLQPQV
jgi:Tat protein secretion system quality control protein TatD with DNase activity